MVQVGEFQYTQDMVQLALDADLSVYRTLEQTMGTLREKDNRTLCDQVIERFVNLGVVENKLLENGLNDFSHAEQEQLKAYAQYEYEQVWQELYRQIEESGDTAKEEDVTNWLTQQGYSLDSLYFEAEVSARYARMLELYCDIIAVSEEEIEAFYQENYVKPDEERYANDIVLFEQEILLTGNESFYQPDGYRYIKHIVLDFPEETKEALSALDTSIQETQLDMEEAHSAIADVVLANGDVEAALAEYQAIVTDLEDLTEQVNDTAHSAIPLLEDTINEIQSRIQAGEPFESLMSEYSTDSMMQLQEDMGYMIHPQSPVWPKEVVAATFALNKPGEVSPPVVSSAGISIIQYVDDVPCGAYALNDEEYSALARTAREDKQFRYLETLIEDWKPMYRIQTHPELLNLD